MQLPEERTQERELLSSSPWDPGTGCLGMAQSCARRGLDWTLGSIFAKRVVRHWDGLPGEVDDAPNLSVLKKHLDNALNNVL